MRNLAKALALVLLLLLLGGCQPGGEPGPNPTEEEPSAAQTVGPAPAESGGNLTNLPATESGTPQSPERQLTREETIRETSLSNAQGLSNSILAAYIWYASPVFYPVGNDTLEQLRDFAVRTSEGSFGFALDQYSIEPTNWGYKVTVTYPLDFWGRSYYVWFEVTPNDPTVVRNTLVSCGSDRRLSYRGLGQDYTKEGFGDDIVLFFGKE